MTLRNKLRQAALGMAIVFAASCAQTPPASPPVPASAPMAAASPAPAPRPTQAAPPAPITTPAPQRAAAGGPNPNHPGRAVYVKACAACHDNTGTTRAITFANMTQLSPQRLREVLGEGGVMQAQASLITADEKTQLISYLTSGQSAAPADWTAAMMCAADKRTVSMPGANAKPAGFAGFGGPGLSGRRELSAAEAGISRADLANLQVAWSIAVPQAQMGTGVVTLGDTAFISVGNRLVALDAGSGCVKWKYDVSSRNTPTIADINGKKALVFATNRGEVHAVSVADGSLIWKADGRPASGRLGLGIRGGMIVYKDKVIVPLSDGGILGSPNGECCDGHGAVTALSAKDGSRLWEYHTMKDAEYTGEVNAKGAKLKGPSGAPIWSVPVIDAKRNLVLVTTGEGTSHPATDTSDSVIALNADTGKMVWKFQAMVKDVWNMQCGASKAASGPNCPWNMPTDTGEGRDFDFGAGAIVTTVGGKDVVLAGQKSGHIWALDGATGKALWSHQIGKGTALGGVHWGIAADGKRVYVPISDSIPGADPLKPGMFAFDIATGKAAWEYDIKKSCDGARGAMATGCDLKFGFSAAPIVIDDAVLAGTLDGRFYAFDGATGKILKQFDFLGPVKTTWGGEGKGGSIDSHSVSVGAGTIFVGAGYNSFSQTGGNVLFALRPKK